MDELFKPLAVGGLELRNRIVMSPMTRRASPRGVPTAAVERYYARRAQAGVGLIVTEAVGIDHGGSVGEGGLDECNIPLMYGADALAGWRKVVEAAHAGGAHIFPQLWHMGPMREPGTGPYPDAPSSRPSGIWGPEGGKATVPPEFIQRMLPVGPALTESEIADIISAFAGAAGNAAQIGFDGIAIHGGHGYLIDTFFWRETNRRGAPWGGDIVQRSRFAAEVVRAIREAVGPAMPIMFRFSQWKQQDYDARLAEGPNELEAMLGPLVDAGVDVFDASARRFYLSAFPGSDLSLAGWAKRVTGRPCMAVGNIGLQRDLYDSLASDGSAAADNLDEARRRLAAGEFDLIGVGRAMLADPEWAAKVASGEPFRPFETSLLQELV